MGNIQAKKPDPADIEERAAIGRALTPTLGT